MTKQLLIAVCVLAGGLAASGLAGAGDGNWPVCCSATSAGFDLNVARTAAGAQVISNSRDLAFSWRVRSRARYDAFNVRVRISDGREGQVEVGGNRYFYTERNAGWSLTYTFLVQGCNKRALSSSACTPWAQIVFRNLHGSNGHVDGVFARNP